MSFPDRFVEEVRRSADIVRVIQDHVALKKVGGSWKGLCPFHQEKTPSFNVRAEPALFHCFGCGVGGDVFKFVMLYERVSFPEAAESLARRFGVPVPERTEGPGPDRKEREEMLALLETAAQHFSRTLWSAGGTRAREYLLGRSFKKETLERIRAGAAREGWDDLLGALRGKFPPAAMAAAGLVLERQDGSGYYDRFRGRAIFPILNESGKVVAFGARSLDGSEPKYLNSPETPVYQKGRTLYGLSWAKEAIRREGRAVLMEGYLDVARALEAGIDEAVATCGTALTPGHARLLHRFTERVDVNFDQDEAGQRAARKSFELLFEEGVRAHVVELPPGEDPDSYIRAAGSQAYRARLAGAPEAIEWLIRREAAANDTGTPGGKAAYLRALLPALVRIESAVERAAWLARVVEGGGLDEAAAREELQRARKGLAASAPPEPAPALSTAMPKAERWLVALLAQGAEGAEEALAELGEADIDGLRSAEVLRAAKALWRRNDKVTAAALASAITGEEAQRLLSEIAVEGAPVSGPSPLECVRVLRRQPLEARLLEIQKRLNAGAERSEELLLEKNRLARQLASL
jgi:DNA primase